MSTQPTMPNLSLSQQDIQDLQAIHAALPDGDPRKGKLTGFLQQRGYLRGQQEFKPGFAEGVAGAVGAPSTPDELTAAEEAAKPSWKEFGLVASGMKPSAMALGMVKDYASNLYDRGKEAVTEAYDAGKNIGEGGPVLPNLGKAAYPTFKTANAAIPLVGEQANKVGEDVAQGNYGAAAGRGLATLATVGIGGEKAGLETPKVPTARGSLAARMAENPPNSHFTRAEILQAAREKGINLDLAQATDHPIANAVKRANQYSLTGSGTYDTVRAGNQSALENAATVEAAQYAPEPVDRSALGSKIQEKLKAEQQSQNDQAGQLLDDITKRVGNSQPDATNIYDAAQNIIGQEKSYYAKNPSLKPGRAFEIVSSIADRARKLQGETKVIRSSKSDPYGTPLMRRVQMNPTIKPDTWSDLHKLRTDVMNEYRSPDIVGTRAEGWLKQLVGVIDNTMTSEAASKLSPVDVEKFRQANKIYADMKDTFDNPQSPFYHAVRSRAPEGVPGMLSKGVTLSGKARQLIGDLEGPLQRRFVEDLIASKDGVTPDFKNLNTKIRRTPNDQLVAVLGAKGARSLRLLGELSSKVTADANPSGTAKIGQSAAEAGTALANPAIGIPELGVQYGAAKAMNSPRLTDYFTKPPRLTKYPY